MKFNGGDIYDHLVSLYGTEIAKIYLPKVIKIIDKFNNKSRFEATTSDLTEKDSILITYADQVTDNVHKPLDLLRRFADKYLRGVINCIHILPFFPYSSDDGFSVIDYYVVNPDYGTWDNISNIRSNFRLMFDAVINHVSSQSKWFQAFIRDKSPEKNYFITVDPYIDLTRVVRPRALPLLTKYDTLAGEKYLWTTFSEDQIDLNFRNPDLLLEVLDILFFYIYQGAEFIRLDAIAFAWKQTGTTCIHLPQTHRLVELFRLVLRKTAPHIKLITETNVAHIENVSYFGNGVNEAHLVYNFALPPLVLFGILTGNAQILTRWASKLELPSQQTTFFNFLASHDGIGLNPARGILSEENIDYLVAHIEIVGGFVSYKDNPDGSQSPYELNINYFDALSDPEISLSELDQINRFILAHAIIFSMIGLPGIYFHSMIGSKGWLKGVQTTKQKRTINRERLFYPQLNDELSDPRNIRHRIYQRLAKLLKIRSSTPAFHPFGSQTVITVDDRIFAYLRNDPHKKYRVLCLNNLSNDDIDVEFSDIIRIIGQDMNGCIDLITKQPIVFNENVRLLVRAYQYLWLTDLN